MRFRKSYIDYKGRKTYDYGNEGYTTVGGTVIYGSSSSSTPSTKPQSSPQSPVVSSTTTTVTTTVISLSAYETNTGDTPGHWTAEVDGLTHISDGTLVSLRISTACFSNSEGYNTLNINGTGAKMVWFDYGKPLKQELATNDEVLLVYREDAGRYTLPNPNPGGLSSDVFPSDGTVRSGWIIVSSDDAAKAGDMKNYYTRDEVDTLISEALAKTISSGQVMTLIENYLEENNYIHYELISIEDYLNLEMPDPNTLYITGVGNYLGTIDMCCGGGGGTGTTPYYVVNPLSISDNGSGGTYTITVMSNTGYTLQSSDNWFTFSPASGYGYGEFTVTIPSGYTYLSGNITIGDKTISIERTGELPYISVSPTSLYSTTAETKTITVTSNTTYSITTDANWITLSQNSGSSGVTTIQVTLDYSGTTRQGTIYIGTEQVSVEQSGDFSTQYLTMRNVGNTDGIFNMATVGYAEESAYFSINNGEWILYSGATTAQKTVPAGSSIRIKNIATGSMSTPKWARMTLSGSTFEVYGNIMSMLHGDNFIGNDTWLSGYTGVCQAAFQNSSCVSAENLYLPDPQGLGEQCYAQLFMGCASLTTAPALPATTLLDYCYQNMFRNCVNLNYVKCLATDISASNCTSSWLSGVSATGTFVKDANMTSWTSGVSGIPSGWTVVDA